jgi:hypothetical protein
VETWFTDHPLEEDRVRATREQISRINPAVIRTLTQNTTSFNSFRARVRSLPAAPAPRR